MTEIFANELRRLMDEHNLSVTALAVNLGVSGQTVKNALDGKSVNARFLEGLVRVFDLKNRPKELRRLLLGTLALLCEGIGGDELLRIAGLDGE